MANLPLDGIRVLDFTWAWAGPFCNLQLAYLGAEVIRVESTLRPCVTRFIPPFADGVAGPNRAGYFNQYNQGKKSILMNLARPEAVEIAGELVKHCDVVTDNFAAGVMDKLGLGYDKLRRFKPDIIMISMSGYGQTGPFKGFVGYGPPAAAAAGMFFGSGYRDGDPAEIGISYADPNAGVFGAFAIITALAQRALTGEGQYIDQSQFETALALMPEGLLMKEMAGREPVRDGNHDFVRSPNECYRAAGDDKWVSIAVGTEDEWRSLCSAMGKPELGSDPRFSSAASRKKNEIALDEMITAWTSTQDRWDVTKKLQAVSVAAFPALTAKDIAEDPDLAERGYLVRHDHPEVGKRIHAGVPWKMSGTPCAVRSAAPIRGADTEAVLKSLLGYSSDRVDQLQKAGILA